MPTTIQYTESFVMDGTKAFVRLAHDIAYKPSVFRVNGVDTPIKQAFVDPGDSLSWFWIAQGRDVHIDTVVNPPNGTTVDIVYESLYSNLVGTTSTSTADLISSINDPLPPGPDPDPNPVDSSQDYTPLSQSGIIQRVLDVPGTVGSTQAASIAAGQARRASLIPEAITADTQWPMPNIGEKVSITLPDYGEDSDFIVAAISSKSRDGVDLGHGTSFETTLELVKLVDPPEQDPPDAAPAVQTISSAYPIYATTPYETLNSRTAIQPTPVQYEYFSIVLGAGADLIAGLQIRNARPILNNGVLLEVYAVAMRPPVAQALVIDVFQDGESIFGAFALVIPAGSSEIFGVTKFRGFPGQYRVRRGSLLTFGAQYLTGTGTPVAAQDVTVYGRWSH